MNILFKKNFQKKFPNTFYPPYFEDNFLNQTPDYLLKVKYYMNKILITEKALNKLYLLGSIEFLATLKCFIIVFCFLPAEF